MYLIFISEESYAKNDIFLIQITEVLNLLPASVHINMYYPGLFINKVNRYFLHIRPHRHFSSRKKVKRMSSLT